MRRWLQWRLPYWATVLFCPTAEMYRRMSFGGRLRVVVEGMFVGLPRRFAHQCVWGVGRFVNPWWLLQKYRYGEICPFCDFMEGERFCPSCEPPCVGCGNPQTPKQVREDWGNEVWCDSCLEEEKANAEPWDEDDDLVV